MFKNLNSEVLRTPSEDLGHFTNRESEQQVLERLTNLSTPHPLPVVMFFGVGGAGKSWLLKRLNQKSANMPTAYVDLDPRNFRQVAQTDPSRVLGDVRRQLGSTIKCPKFDLAYAWLRYKEGLEDEPLFKGSGPLGVAWEFVVEAGDAAASDIPGASLVTWLLNKITGNLKDKLNDYGLGDYLAKTLGQDDFIYLKQQHPSDIYLELTQRLLQDLKRHLPDRNGKACRAIVFIDTLETLRSHRDSKERVLDAYAWLKELYHPESGLQLILAGRDRLGWDVDTSSHFAQASHLEQHLVGGLSESDARMFLNHCEISEHALQSAILKACEDEGEPEESEQGYHAFSLGLCADTCWNLKQNGVVIDPNEFDMTSEDYQSLAARFLRSLGGDGVYAQWLKKLSLTVRFDELAGRTCFSETPSPEQDFAWSSLITYSFIQRVDDGWYSLHVRMKEALEEIQQASQKDHWRSNHDYWQDYWQSRSMQTIDQYAAFAWFHYWILEPPQARLAWDQAIETALHSLRVTDHQALLSWWEPCRLDEDISSSDRCKNAAAALNSLGVEYSNSPLGNRSHNLSKAIECYQVALQVYTEAKFPQDWAMTQNNLGIAYRNLPDGDRTENLRNAIRYYEAALQVYTEAKFPQEWAATQNNLGIAYGDLPSGDRAENLRNAIRCCEAALQVYTEAKFPQEWAMTQNNLGNAYGSLPSDDRVENLRNAIRCYEAALQVYTEAKFPQNWATTQNNLGNAYGSLPSGDRVENLRNAIRCYEAALQVYTEAKFPQNWATTQNNLGSAYRNLPDGDRAENLRNAIRCYEAALQVYTEAKFPQDWAMTQNNLGIAYRNLPDGDQAENLRNAIRYYEAALQVYTEAKFPQEWAATQNNLGIAYGDLPSGDRAENLRNAIRCYEAALQVYTEAKFPQEWATTQNNLGIAYRDLLSGDRAKNLRNAIRCYEAALKVYTEAAFPEKWAITQNNLNVTQRELEDLGEL